MAGNTLTWRSKTSFVALAEPGGRLVACAGLVPAEIEPADHARISVVGVGGVIVAAPFRGRGIADRAITAALDRAATMGPEIAMLFCLRSRAGLYARHGFAEIDPPIRVEQPHGLVEIPQVGMWRALRPHIKLPNPPITLRGLPF
jgi:GNAT superfamily N-acetyltransferase